MRRFLPDAFTLTLIATVILASVFPAVGRGVVHAGRQQRGDLAAVFLHGARLSTDAIVAGVKDLRLHA